MERKKGDRKSGGGGEREDRVLHGAGGSGPPRGEHDELEEELGTALADWNLYDSTFMTKCGNHVFVLKLKSVAYDEEPHHQVIKQHGNQVSLIGVYGKSAKFSRERLLGYILLYVGTPIVHMHTWYVAICYSEESDVRRKDPALIATDDNIRLFKAGIGKCDYLFSYKSKTREHDEAGFSDGATHIETAGSWKDGL